VLNFSVVQSGCIVITEEEGVKDSRPTSSLIKFRGCTVVIDTEHPKEDGTEYLKAFARTGHSPSSVDFVLFTHLHPDHFGHKELFSHATFVYHRDDRFGFYFRNDKRIVLSASAVLDLDAGPGAEPVYIAGEPDLRNLGSRLYIRHSPGHTPGSLMIFGTVGTLVHAWVGDVFLNQDYFDEWRPPGSSWDQRLICPHMQYARDNADIIVPGHGEPFRTNRGR